MLSNILYTEYMSEDEIALEAAIEAADIKVERALSAYRAICEKAELDLREAELQCFQESGSMDDLADFYTEAEQKTEEKKKGLLTRIWEAIKEMIKSVKEFFTGKKDEIDPEGTYEVPEGAMNAIQKFAGWLKGKGKGILDWIKKYWKIIMAGGAIAGVPLAAVAIIKRDKIKEALNSKKMKVKGQKILDAAASADSALDTLQGIADYCEQDKSGDNNEAGNPIKTLISNIKDLVAGLFKAAGAKISKTLNKKKNEQLAKEMGGRAALRKKTREEIETQRKKDSGKTYKRSDGIVVHPATDKDDTFDRSSDANAVDPDTGEDMYVASAQDTLYDDFDVEFESSNDYEDDIYNDDPYGESMTESMNDIDHLLDDLLGGSN